jgi:hypothetical protein
LLRRFTPAEIKVASDPGVAERHFVSPACRSPALERGLRDTSSVRSQTGTRRVNQASLTVNET